MKNLKIEAFLLMIGLIFMGLCLKIGLGRVNRDVRTVNVRGLAEMDVEANKVTWPIAVKEAGNDLSAVYAQVSKSADVVVKFLKDNGLTDEEIAVTAPSVVDRATNYYDNSWKQRYNVTTNIVVTSNKVKLVMELIPRQGELIAKGVAINSSEYGNYTNYEYTELNSIKPQMIEEATKNARAAAEKFAKDSESKLGKIKTANQGLFTIENVDEYTPNVKHVRVVTNVTYFLED
ncbi:MAG: SIMPL domain-containing protein [Bacteroidales bacterium]|nr:SIMPL domain-containing protein [Bacteroidales bacterium]